MSVQFGKCNFDGRPVSPEDLDQVRPVLAPYGPDGEGYLCDEQSGDSLSCVLHNEGIPHGRAASRLPSGAVITWEGGSIIAKTSLSHLPGELSPEAHRFGNCGRRLRKLA